MVSMYLLIQYIVLFRFELRNGQAKPKTPIRSMKTSNNHSDGLVPHVMSILAIAQCSHSQMIFRLQHVSMARECGILTYNDT